MEIESYYPVDPYDAILDVVQFVFGRQVGNRSLSGVEMLPLDPIVNYHSTKSLINGAIDDMKMYCNTKPPRSSHGRYTESS